MLGNEELLELFTLIFIYLMILITSQSSAAGRTRSRLGNTGTCQYVRFEI